MIVTLFYVILLDRCHDIFVSMITELKFVCLTFLFDLIPMEIKGIQKRCGFKDPQDNKNSQVDTTCL